MVEKTVQKAALSSVQLLWSGFSWFFMGLLRPRNGLFMANAKGFCIAAEVFEYPVDGAMLATKAGWWSHGSRVQGAAERLRGSVLSHAKA